MSTHSEEWCMRCGGANPVWTAPSPLWNQVMRDGDINNPDKFSVVCPACFAWLAEGAGIAFGWRFYATDVRVKLQDVTPSGRVWNPDTWLFDMVLP